MEGPFGFCLFASRPGKWSAWTPFYVGRLKGVGAVWQLTAVDVATRIAVVQAHRRRQDRRDRRRVSVSPEEGPAPPRHHPRRSPDRQRTRVHRQGLHYRPDRPGSDPPPDPARSPNHNAVCERFHGTVLRASSTDHISTAAASTTSPCSTDPCKPGSTTTTTTAPTTATTWPDAPQSKPRSNCNAGPGILQPDHPPTSPETPTCHPDP